MQTAWDARGGHVHASSKAKVQIVGGIGAVLETQADHGCTQWERTLNNHPFRLPRVPEMPSSPAPHGSRSRTTW
jgi:hypothetical protein